MGLRMSLLALVLATGTTGCGGDEKPPEMLPASVQRGLPVEPPGTAVSLSCATDFAPKVVAKFRRQGRAQLVALKNAYRRYPGRGVVVTYDTQENPGKPEQHVWTVRELLDSELSTVDPAAAIDERPAIESLPPCQRRAIRELQALKR